LARADEQGLPLRVADVELDDVLDTECRRLHTAGTVPVDCTVHPVRVHGDAAQLGRTAPPC